MVTSPHHPALNTRTIQLLRVRTRVSRLRFDEGLDLDLTWVVSHLSELEILFGGQITEDFYENGKKLANFDINPSTIQYKFSISYVRIRLYDTFSYTNDPTLDPTVTNITYLHNLTNIVRRFGRHGFRYSNPLAFS